MISGSKARRNSFQLVCQLGWWWGGLSTRISEPPFIRTLPGYRAPPVVGASSPWGFRTWHIRDGIFSGACRRICLAVGFSSGGRDCELRSASSRPSHRRNRATIVCRKSRTSTSHGRISSSGGRIFESWRSLMKPLSSTKNQHGGVQENTGKWSASTLSFFFK